MRSRVAVRAWGSWLASIVLLALVGRILLGSAPLNYDTAYALVWGGEVLDGNLPDYRAFGAPTPHPLLIAICAAVGVTGNAAYTLLEWLGLLAGAGALVALFRLARGASSVPAGLLAAAILATSWIFCSLAVTAAKDVLFVALVLLAGALEAERPRRGVSVLVLLGVAGLIRPDAWFLSGLYWLWLAPGLSMRSRASHAGIALVAPMLWFASDAIVAGSPTFSLTRTQDLAIVLDRPRGLENVPSELTEQLSRLIGTPTVIAGFVGSSLLLEAHFRGRRRTVGSLVPTAIAAVGIAVFFGQGALDLPLTGRLLLVVAAAFAAVTGVALVLWQQEAEKRRTALLLIAALIALGLVADAPSRVAELRDERARLADSDRKFDAFRALLQEPETRQVLARCRRIALALEPVDAIQVPYMAHLLDRPSSSLASTTGLTEPPDALVVWTTASEDMQAGSASAAHAHTLASRMQAIAENEGWTVYARHAGC